ncbi:MAG: hypothetical protein ACPGLV_11355 [Bacteroidia bacterium]
MKNLSVLLLIIISASFTLSSCSTDDDDLCDYENKYPDMSIIQFEVDGEAFTQNINSGSYNNASDRPALTKIYEEFDVGPTESNFNLYFTHIKFLNNPPECEARWNHRITINANIDQRPNETKVYKVDGNPSNENHVIAAYTPSNSLPSQNDNDVNNTLTITRFIPQNVLEGSFNITFRNGTKTSGSFELDLTENY